MAGSLYRNEIEYLTNFTVLIPIYTLIFVMTFFNVCLSALACFTRSAFRFVQKVIVRWDGFDAKYLQTLAVNDKNVDIKYWNSYVTPQRNNNNNYNNNNISKIV